VGVTTIRSLAALAAGARIREKGAEMSGRAATTPDAKAMARAMWALGDYHRFARELVWEVGPVLVDACAIRPGDRVLDVAAGTGNVAIRAAERGADVVASDLTPENFAAGRREAAARGVELEWVEADAEALPFADDTFDAVTSCFGAMFAPDHQTVAKELLRVCRPGGTIGLASFAPRGTAASFFGIVARHAPPPPADALPPLLWGDEDHVRALFGDRVASLELARRTYVERAATTTAYRQLFEETFGPLIALRAALADDPDRAAALDRDFAEFTERANEGTSGGPAEYVYEYLLVVAELTP
jgi:ubiquinone/menaquinone biosynthesis C-methylase UbiE